MVKESRLLIMFNPYFVSVKRKKYNCEMLNSERRKTRCVLQDKMLNKPQTFSEMEMSCKAHLVTTFFISGLMGVALLGRMKTAG